jgi:carbamoyl-phosphate synthase small subunit
MSKKRVWLYLENGLFLEASSFGGSGTKVGEIVFNTSMSGYQEIMSDASYAGQFVVFTMPEVGNVGCNANDMESKSVYASGMIVRNYQERYSNFRAEESLGTFLKRYNSFGICDIDTRYLTKMLRDEGAQMMIASTEISDKETLKALLEKAPRIEEVNYIQEVSTKEVYEHESGTWDALHQRYQEPTSNGKKIAVIDFGVKRNILNELRQTGLRVEVLPYTFSAESLIKRVASREIDGVFLSNGPGDPLILEEEATKIRELIDAKVPMFAICLGHQLLSIAHGYKTYKLKFGHHGGNHPVQNEKSRAVEITAQNHNYNVPDTLCDIAKVTHKNLFDGTIEGVVYHDSNIFSVQHHPEASPGPHDSKYIFNEFAQMLSK